MSDSGSQWIIGPTEDIRKFYKFGKNLGQPGQFGRAVLAVKRTADGGVDKSVQYAVKVINKARFARNRKHAAQVYESFRGEIEVMKKMEHPNIIKFHEVFEEPLHLFIVMELCTGGELFDRITARRNYSEKDAAIVLKQILEGVNYMHQQRIAHCDLKPDNFLFKDSSDDSALKVIDFGMSKHVRHREYLSKFCGTPYYVAPEVIDGQYTEACDVWSIGVVMFVMLHGYPPFYADPKKYGSQADNYVYQKIKGGFNPVVKSGYGNWFPEKIPISNDAKDLITKMLTMSVTDRYTCQEALEHPWMTGSASDAPIGESIVRALQEFDSQHKLKEAVLHLMTDTLSDSEVDHLKATFEAMDENKDGTISAEELKKALAAKDSDIDVDVVRDIMERADLNKDGVLSYKELMLTYVQRKLNLKEERLWDAFCKCDRNGDGRISNAELRIVLQEGGYDEKPVEDLIAEADKNGDGSIDYDEFLNLWMKDQSF